MTLLMRDQENIERGRLEGIKEGIQKGKLEGMEEGIQKGKLEGMEEGIQKGKLEGMEEGIRQLVSTLHDLGVSDEIILQKLQEKFPFSKEEAEKFL